jgi:hypothetical protein
MLTLSGDPIANWLLTKVIYKDGSFQYGYFKAFDDHKELVAKGSYRFIPVIYYLDLRKEYQRTQKLNKLYSVVIDEQAVEDIELLRV